MSKLIVFGDSFTKCFSLDQMSFTLIDPLTFKDFKFNREKDKVSNWTEPLAKSLGCEEVLNYSWWGVSNYIILDNLISNLHKITEHDIVVIGSSTTERYTYFYNDSTDLSSSGNKMTTLNQSCVGELVEHLDEENSFTTKRIPWKNFDNEKISTILDFYFNNTSLGDNGTHTFIQNIKHIEKLDYLSEFIRKTVGCRVLRWPWDIWSYKVHPPLVADDNELDNVWGSSCIFETNYIWMNKTVRDGHWSPNGLRGAALFFEYCIKSGIHYVDIKELAHWYLSQGKVQMDALDYITYQPR